MAGHEAGGTKRLWVLILIALAVAAAGLRALTSQPVAAAVPIQQGINRAGVVVSFGESVQTRCVTFSEPVILADALLASAGFRFETNHEGDVCSIDGVGCPASDCYCQCTMTECMFWGYFHLTASGWQHEIGIPAQYEVTDGAVEGWVWAAGNPSIGVPPPSITLEQICSPSGDTLTPSITIVPPVTATPTSPATTSTPLAPLTMTFQADRTQIAAGTCTWLRWQVFNASKVILDGVRVSAQDQKEVCPPATQRYVLEASTVAGQMMTQEVVVQVLPVAPGTATVTPVQSLTAAPPGVVAPTTVQSMTPVAEAPTAIFATATPTSVAAVPSLRAVASATPTRRPLPGGPTATPLLRPISAPASPTAATEVPDVPLSQRLLPLALGFLLAAGGLFFGFWVLRRKARPER